MLTLKQAFSTAAALQNAKTQVKLCEACPMHALHKLCERIEGMTLTSHFFTILTNRKSFYVYSAQRLKLPIHI